MTDVSRLIQFAFSGRAILLAGQELDPGTTKRLLSSLAKSLNVATDATLGDALASLSDPAPVITAVKSIAELGVPSGLRRVAQVPWAAVFTSAFDDRISTELAAQDSQGRRLRHLCVDDEMPAFFPRRNDVLAVLHLTHLANEQTATGLPVYGRHWGRAQRLLIPGILRTLPQAVGPAHLLCIAGIAANDPVDASLVADFANELDPDNVYWFISASDGLNAAELRKLAPNIHFVESDLPSALESYAESAPADVAPSALKNRVLELQDLVITTKSLDAQRTITFRATELREFRRHLVILPDLTPQGLSADLSKRKQDFIRFLSLSRQTPDWDGIGEGFAFQRDAYDKLLELVLERVGVLQGSQPRRQSKRRGGENAPIYLAGPPASGRTVGLLWLGYHLRRNGIFVVQLLPSGGMVDNAAVEQILRLAESRGAVAAVVLLDRADRRVAENLDRQLRSAGRRSVVVASVAPQMGHQRPKADDVDQEETSRGTEVRLDYALTEPEVRKFRSYLEINYGSVDIELVLSLLASDPAIFALLYRLIPDTRENIRSVLVEEYLDLVEGLTSFRPPKEERVGSGVLSEKLNAWLEHRKREQEKPKESASVPHTDPWYHIATQLPQLVLLFSSLDEAISLNLLTKRFPGLLQIYRSLRDTLQNSGLFQEVALDKENDIGLTAVNPLVAQLLLNACLPSSVARIKLLGALFFEFPWDAEIRPIDSPEQALLIHVIRSISPPSGSFQGEYQRTEDLRALAELLRQLREDHGVLLPQLLLAEGIILRYVGRRLGDNDRIADALVYYRLSRSVLETARDVLARRRPSPARNFEMSMVLNAIATTIGHTFNAESRAERVDEAECRELVEGALDTASESRAYTDAYHPLDTAFWTNRDFYNYLGDRPDSEEVRLERERALLSMADALDKAAELGELREDQADRLGGRLVQLDTYLQNVEGARQRAEEDAKLGRFSGVCLLARLKAIDSRTSRIVNTSEAEEALRDLEGYAPRILSDDRALTLMHRLWVGAHLGNQSLDEGPYAIGCGLRAWRQLENIVNARRELSKNTKIPYVNFWLAVALAQQGDMRRALQMLEEVQANSLGFSHRRLTPLIYLSDEQAVAKRFSAIVRRREDDDLLTVYVPALAIEVKIPKRNQGQAAMGNLQRGDEVTVLVALSYWNPVAVGPAWEESRSKRGNGTSVSKSAN